MPTERNADGALAACFVVVGANGVVPSTKTNGDRAWAGWCALLVQKRVVRSAIDSYGRIYFRAAGISPHSRESTPRGVKELAFIDTSLTLQGVAHDWES
jgi:hypothetical protein